MSLEKCEFARDLRWTRQSVFPNLESRRAAEGLVLHAVLLAGENQGVRTFSGAGVRRGQSHALRPETSRRRVRASVVRRRRQPQDSRHHFVEVHVLEPGTVTPMPELRSRGDEQTVHGAKPRVVSVLAAHAPAGLLPLGAPARLW